MTKENPYREYLRDKKRGRSYQKSVGTAYQEKFKKQTLTKRVEELEEIINSSDLYTENFIKRAFTVFGHILVAYLIVWLAFVVIMAFVSIIA